LIKPVFCFIVFKKMAGDTMSDNVENLVLEHLRALRAGQDRIENELRDIKSRVSAVETGLNGVRRDLVALAEADARLQVTVDRMGDRVDRLERRLELREN
jgi:predicted nuclease with TOPRIM domain